MTKHSNILHFLEIYKSFWKNPRFDQINGDEEINVERFRSFVAKHDDCFERSLGIGHVTGSALITTPCFSKVLLTHHKKLNRWLQLGGHADGNPNALEVALQEAEEESGLSNFTPYNYCNSEIPVPFDLDIHLIPPNKKDAEHLHYDVRYLLVTNEPDAIICSEESIALRWFPLDEARGITDEPSMLRQFDKLGLVRDNIV